MTGWEGNREGRHGWGEVSCSALSGTPFLQCWNMVPLIEVDLKKKVILFLYSENYFISYRMDHF